MLQQMRMLYCRSNRLVRQISMCSTPLLLALCRSFCTVFYCSYFWTNNKKQHFLRSALLKTTYIARYLGVPKRGSACRMLVSICLTISLILKL